MGVGVKQAFQKEYFQVIAKEENPLSLWQSLYQV